MKRPFTPLEHSYLALDTDSNSPMGNQYVLEGVGHFSQMEWKSALEKVVEANPGLSMVLKGRWFWRKWVFDERVFPEILNMKHHWKGDSSEGAFFDENKLNCLEGKHAQVILVEGDYPKIIFRTHHALMDGNATLFWIQEVFRALRGEELHGSDCDKNEVDFLSFKRKTKTEALSGQWSPVSQVKPAKQHKLGHQWINIQFDKSNKNILPETINFLRKAILQNNPKAKMVFRVPTDLRRLQTEDESYLLSNCVAALDMELGVDDSSKSIYKNILKGLQKNKDLNIFPAGYKFGNLLTEGFFKVKDDYYLKLYEKQECDISAIVTHVGKVGLAEVSCDSFMAKNIYAIPVPLPGVSFSCVFLEHDTNISACIAMPEAYGDLEIIRELARALQDHFLACADN